MPGLPWVRLDTATPSHDKVIALLAQRGGDRAMLVYLFSLAWSGGQGTDGHIPKAALGFIHGTERQARMLVDHRLWEYAPDNSGWLIHNWAERQQAADVTDARTAAYSTAGRRAACARWHEPGCDCWTRPEANGHGPPRRTALRSHMRT